MEEKNKLKIITYIFLLLLVTGTIGYMILLKINLVDALYMTVITISTVGYGEVAKMDTPAKIFSIFMIFWGVGIVGYAFTTIVVMFVEGKITDIWKGRKMDNRIANLNNHYIICGAGEMADVIIENFTKENLDFVVIDQDPQVVQAHGDNNILVIEGDTTQEKVLEKAGVSRAKGLISVLSTDVENIVTVLTARTMNPDLYIISRAIHKTCPEKLKKVGADKTLSAVEIGGRRMAALMTKPNIISFLDVITRVGDLELDLEEVKIEAGSSLDKIMIKDAQIPKKTGLIVLAIKEVNNKDLIFNPTPEHIFEEGDVLLVLGSEDKVKKLRSLAKQN